MKSIKKFINENKTLSNNSKYTKQDIINLELKFSILVGLKFKVTYTATENNIFLNLPKFDFNPMCKEINHVIAHMIESYINPKAILNYINKKNDQLDIGNLEIKTCYKDLDKNGNTPNHQKLYFSSISQYENLQKPNSMLLYIYYELDDTLEATIKKVYLRPSNMIESTKQEFIDKNGNTLLKHPCKMCITKLIPITKGNGQI